MQTFTDNQGRTWSIRIDVNAMRRLREQLGVDLNSLHGENSVIIELANDPCKLVDVIYVLVKAQCETQNVTAEAFGAALVGDAIDVATDAFLEALVAFFPPSRRKPLKAALETSKRGQAKAMEIFDEAMDNGLMEKQMDKWLGELRANLAKASS